MSQYAFCRKAWWLGTVQAIPAQTLEPLERGQRYHRQHGAKVARAWQKRRAGLILMIAGGCLLLMALLGTWIGGLL
ncbi:MAG: hypothetical protein ACE5H9_03750 [Anaerolineae bacterium]